MGLSRRKLLRSGGVVVTAAGAAAAAGAYATLVMTDRDAQWQPLRDAMTGELTLPGDSRYGQARRLFLARFDTVLPAAVAHCETAADVQACVRFARDRDLPIAVRSSGHSYQGWSTTRGLVIDLSRMDQVERWGPGVVRLGPGAQAVGVVDALAPHGIAVPTAICASVATGGYLTGGGISLQTRKYGMGVDRLTAAEVVLADGQVVYCSEQREPELFWAVRGGLAGNFGVVTQLRVRPYPAARMVNYNLVWQWDHAPEAIEGFMRWYAAAPDELSALFTVVLPNAAPGEVPFVVLDGGWLGAPEDLEQLLDELVAEVGREPLERTVEEESFQRAMMAWFECGDLSVEQCRLVGYHPEAMLPRDNHVTMRNRLLRRPVPRSGVDEMLTAYDAMRREGHFRFLWLMGMGGQANRVSRDATAWAHRDAEFLLCYIDAQYTSVPDSEEVAAAQEWANGGFAVADRYGTGATYVNFPDPVLAGWQEAYYAENYERLRQVKRRYDPDDFFWLPQGVEL